MYTEVQMWDLYWSGMLATAGFFLAWAFLLWVSLRAANIAGDSDNMISKIAVTVFCLVVVWQINFIVAQIEWIFNGISGAFVALQTAGTEISSGAQEMIAAAEPGAAFNLMPDMISGIFILAILVMQLTTIWMKK
tara:strand:- start:1129 stop:1533 length:405 start_codon:yes stop_codon:yes gene_type:complete